MNSKPDRPFPTKLELIDAAHLVVAKKLGRDLTPLEKYQLSYAAELDFELWLLGFELPDPQTYGQRDLSWLAS